MDVREKLVELLGNLFCGDYGIDGCDSCKYNTEVMCSAYACADSLIANGVTVQELDGCEYCKEDGEGYRKMFGAFSITNPFHGNEWLINTGHCKPRQIYFCPMCGRRLPQPPKGE